VNLRAGIDEGEFNAAIARVHDYIRAGDNYQTNFTYRLHFEAYGAPLSLYRKLRERQAVPFGALIALPDGRAVLSLSPELFVRYSDGIATARPMKGTAAIYGDSEQHALLASQLAADPKSRAENLMIVDLLRNDLGRIAVPGSVQVPALFEVKRFGDLLQMTSTIQAQVRDEITLADLLMAVYPCGSITGAPKRRSMQIIRELEIESRAYYTGALGWINAPDEGKRIGDFCLSVPIRTLVLGAPENDGLRTGQLGVGAGIVHDSVAADEYAECKLKASFLTGLPKNFALLETIHATRANGYRNLDLHLQRLRSSAAYFGFAYDEGAIRAMLNRICKALPDSGEHRVRLALDQAGACAVQSAPLRSCDEPVKLLLASHPTMADDLFLRHKTTVRERYDAAWRAAEERGAFDLLFFNSLGELTEGARSNIFIRLSGRWYTPPLASGVLPGIMRGLLLGDPAWHACERRLTLQDLRDADEIVVCNALRGALRAQVDFNQISGL
jgi:para-aminobenzoate synthetase/4-amino-4-deoxychorismate lyase